MTGGQVVSLCLFLFHPALLCLYILDHLSRLWIAFMIGSGASTILLFMGKVTGRKWVFHSMCLCSFWSKTAILVYGNIMEYNLCQMPCKQMKAKHSLNLNQNQTTRRMIPGVLNSFYMLKCVLYDSSPGQHGSFITNSDWYHWILS